MLAIPDTIPSLMEPRSGEESPAWEQNLSKNADSSLLMVTQNDMTRSVTCKLALLDKKVVSECSLSYVILVRKKLYHARQPVKKYLWLILLLAVKTTG